MSDLKVELPDDLTLSDAEALLGELAEKHNELVDRVADVEGNATAAHDRVNNLVGELGGLKQTMNGESDE